MILNSATLVLKVPLSWAMISLRWCSWGIRLKAESQLNVVTYHLFSEDLQVSRSPLGSTWTTQMSQHRQRADIVSSVDIFPPSVCLPFQWGCRWPWQVLLLPTWCSCWASSNLHEACKTQTSVQAVRGGEKLQNIRRETRNPEQREGEEKPIAEHPHKFEKRRQIYNQLKGQLWNPAQNNR